jgi:hypothetical protein
MCRSKVIDLHNEIAQCSNGEVSEKAGSLVASILIDGKSCNQYLIKHLDSRRQLPELPFFREFQLTELSGENLAPLLIDEQGLMLWMLYRINPDRLMPSIDFYVDCENENEELRNMLAENWRFALLGSDVRKSSGQ